MGWLSNGSQRFTDGCKIFGALTDEAVRNGSIKKVEKRGNAGEPSKDRGGRNDNRRNRTGNAFATTVNHVGRGPYRTCFNCNCPSHLAKDCRGVPRNVNPVNARNPTVRAYYECGSTNHVRSACPRMNKAQRPEENLPNQVAANNGGTFTLNNHFATTLFDAGSDYSFVSTTFIPQLGLETSDLGFRYEIEIASGKLVEIDKVVRIPLPDVKVLRVLGERPKEKARFLMGAKASDKKQEEIVVVRDFPEVFSDDLSRLPHIQEIEFRIELTTGATPVANFNQGNTSYRPPDC
ncbi:putative reverse transcriptase domain-containing protein [Tanacetum coccineum]